jgi:hypothetical protein
MALRDVRLHKRLDTAAQAGTLPTTWAHQPWLAGLQWRMHLVTFPQACRHGWPAQSCLDRVVESESLRSVRWQSWPCRDFKRCAADLPLASSRRTADALGAAPGWRAALLPCCCQKPLSGGQFAMLLDRVRSTAGGHPTRPERQPSIQSGPCERGCQSLPQVSLMHPAHAPPPSRAVPAVAAVRPALSRRCPAHHDGRNIASSTSTASASSSDRPFQNRSGWRSISGGRLRLRNAALGRRRSCTNSDSAS